LTYGNLNPESSPPLLRALFGLSSFGRAIMDDLLVVLEGLVVLGAIFLGVHMGGIRLGLWGVAGTAVLVFGFQEDPGTPPVDAFKRTQSLDTRARDSGPDPEGAKCARVNAE
jgi:hypothetical protein